MVVADRRGWWWWWWWVVAREWALDGCDVGCEGMFRAPPGVLTSNPAPCAPPPARLLAKVGKNLDVMPGEEFRVALREAHAIGAQVRRWREAGCACCACRRAARAGARALLCTARPRLSLTPSPPARPRWYWVTAS